jgi:hypothetical protein
VKSELDSQPNDPEQGVVVVQKDHDLQAFKAKIDTWR